jgi:DNA-binding MarR family transcriptional regulator
MLTSGMDDCGPGGPHADPADTTMRAWIGFLRAYRAVVGDLDAELQYAHHLPLSEFDVLAQLAGAANHRLRMSELADAVLLSRSGLTRLVDRLERAQLAVRLSCPSDRRGTHCQLTEHGAAVIAATRRTHLEGVRRRFAAHLTGHELAVMADAFERLAGTGDPLPAAVPAAR